MPSRTQSTFKRKIQALRKNQTDILVMHYACQNFGEVKSGFPEIYAVVVQEHGTSNGLHTFSCNDFACEKTLLNDFFRLLQKNKTHKFVHWNMNDERFGLRAIEGRYKQLHGQSPYRLSPNQLYDFDDMVEEAFGKNYVQTQKKFLGLLQRNGLDSPDISWGAEEANLFKEGHTFRGQTSTITKVRALDKLLTLYFDDSLKTDIPIKRKPWAILKLAGWVVGAISFVSAVFGILSFLGYKAQP